MSPPSTLKLPTLKYLFSEILFVFSIILYSQGPSAVSVSSCVDIASIANGTYTRSVDVNGCDCYDKDIGGGRLYFINNGFTYLPTKNCSDGGVGDGPTIVINSDCDNILIGTAVNSCTVVEENSIPTLSQWGLYILSLSFLILGTIAIRQVIFKVA